ncbi:MAG: hypothetical protein H6Q68_1696 [Firmicutes bacterium]|nr:hypothetical protein [Bacillota bacterium]
MRKVERVKAVLASRSLDRPSVSSWIHYPSVDQDPLKVAYYLFIAIFKKI